MKERNFDEETLSESSAACLSQKKSSQKQREGACSSSLVLVLALSSPAPAPERAKSRLLNAQHQRINEKQEERERAKRERELKTMLARSKKRSGAWSCVAACGTLLALLLVALSGPVSAAYDDAQCESHVYPLDGSTLKPVRERGFFFILLGRRPSLRRRRRRDGHAI